VTSKILCGSIPPTRNESNPPAAQLPFSGFEKKSLPIQVSPAEHRTPSLETKKLKCFILIKFELSFQAASLSNLF